MPYNRTLQTYDAAAVSIVVGGIIVTGWGDGNYITVERNADSWMRKTGTDGVTTRSKSNDKTGRITIVLNGGSASNDALSALGNADERSGAGVVTFMLRDGSGTLLCSAAQMWMVKPPTVELGRESNDRTYVFETNSLDIFAGGNAVA